MNPIIVVASEMQNRNTNIEWLRIIAMFMILFSHFSFHGFISPGNINSIDNVFNRFWLELTVTGNIGNCLFMLISGYFLVTSKAVRIRKLVSIVVQVLTYSLTCYVLYGILVGDGSINPKDLFRALTPLIHETNWYFSTYVLIYLFHPYLNRLIENLSREEHRSAILLGIAAWSIVPTLFPSFSNSNFFLLFALMYFIGAYLHLYPEGKWIMRYKSALVAGVLIWVLVASSAIWVGAKMSEMMKVRLFSLVSPLVIVISVSLFLTFLHLESKTSGVINRVAACMGGVYLLHDNPYVRSVLYSDIFHLSQWGNSIYLPLVIIGFILITFIS